MKLEQLQNDFIAAIFNADRDAALDYVKGDDRLDASQRLGIYRGSVHGILTQSLGDTFPVCKELLGDEFFDKMCDRFIDKYPPTTPFFSDFGDNLSQFLKQFEPVESIPFIPDVAEFEWIRNKLWLQTTGKPFDFSTIATLTEEQQANLVFHLSPTLHLFQSDYRIDDIWFAHQQKSDIELENININTEIRLTLWKADESIKLANHESTNTVFDNTNLTDLDYWNFLKAISKGKTITQLATEFDVKFPELLNQGIKDAWIGSFTYD